MHECSARLEEIDGIGALSQRSRSDPPYLQWAKAATIFSQFRDSQVSNHGIRVGGIRVSRTTGWQVMMLAAAGATGLKIPMT
jgi:hypothetical protein